MPGLNQNRHYLLNRGRTRSHKAVFGPFLQREGTVMKIEIIFHTSSTPKKCTKVEAVYTKGGLLVVQYQDGLMVKYPLCNVFSIAGYHTCHLGSTK